jgi:capsular exopolysaccharide synthesis family protein
VVVDADLRRPSLHQFFNLRNARGLSNVLLESEPRPEQALQSTSVDGLKVLPSGPLPPNPSELLGHSRMHQVIAALKNNFDLVIFDLPPALAVTDAAVLGRQVDGILLVADHGRTKLGALNKARDELARVGGRVLGVTLNRLPAGKRSSYYYEDYQASAPDESGLRRVGHRLRELIPGPRRA